MTQAGFWRNYQPNNNQLILGNYKGVANQVHYLFPDGNGPGSAFTTFADLSPHLRSRDVIVLGGVLREQAIAPLGVFDVLLIGAANKPRQATANDVPTGGGACWLPPVSGAVSGQANLELREQGWMVSNILFNSTTSAAGIKLTRAETATYPDPSYATISGCKFSGVDGIVDSGGSSHNLIEDNIFQSLTGTGIKSIAGAAIADCLSSIVRNNFFNQNANNIVSAATHWLIDGNRMIHTTTQKVKLSGSPGGYNYVINNGFEDVEADIDISHGYTGISTDVWRNYSKDVAAQTVGYATT